MSDEDFNPEMHAEIVVGGDLSMLSIAELEERISLFEKEIGRIKIDISTKQASREVADSVFRS